MTTYWSELKIKEGDDGILNFIFTPTEKEFDPLSFLLPTADLNGEISGPPLDDSEPQGSYAPQCRNCGAYEMNLQDSNRYNDITEQANYYGLDSLTEGEQTILDGVYCAECIDYIQQENDLIDPEDAIIDTQLNGDRAVFWAKDAPRDYDDMAEELKQLFFQYTYIQKKHGLEQTFEQWRDGTMISDAHKIFIMAREGWQLIPASWYTQIGDDDSEEEEEEEETLEDRLARIREEIYFYTIESPELSKEDKELYRANEEDDNASKQQDTQEEWWSEQINTKLADTIAILEEQVETAFNRYAESNHFAYHNGKELTPCLAEDLISTYSSYTTLTTALFSARVAAELIEKTDNPRRAIYLAYNAAAAALYGASERASDASFEWYKEGDADREEPI